MFDRVVLSRDLVDVRGGVLGQAGLVISVASVHEAARNAPAMPCRLLSETPAAEDLHLPLADPPYRHLFRGSGVQAAVARVLLGVSLPQQLFDELASLKISDPSRYRHGLTTAAVTARMLISAVGDAPALPDLAAAGLLHDIGMRHLSFHLVRNGDRLDQREVMDVASHPLLGAWHLANVLGTHPAVEAALAHHWRNGYGYPSLPSSPPRAVQVVGVASAFAALTQTRAFRSEPFDARGAADVLICEAGAGHADMNTVRLLVHALRGAKGEMRQVRFGRHRLGHAPTVNRHTTIGPVQAAV
ncbi:MAG: phosphohydrolase [Anaeromyxobacter sp. RBG_16_69_14]|nr:MAG: phosphohydrolase [Anaeromyxobacter sp. RBG_16_69_14]